MMQRFRTRSLSKIDKALFDSRADEFGERRSSDGASSHGSFDRFCADILGDSISTNSPRDPFWGGDESTSTSLESSPVAWPRTSREKSRLGKPHSLPCVIETFRSWDGKAEDFLEEMSEADMMKERFSKLLLGEDLSGGGKGVCSALAISNAITNLSASVFGQLWRAEPLPEACKARWQREMGWLLSVNDHIVEFVPSQQLLPNGCTTEVMVTKPRSDLDVNLPALQKLDKMLIEALDSFVDYEFWYVDQNSDAGADMGSEHDPPRREEKWWLPTPRVPVDGGLSPDARERLQLQRDNVNQILKAVLTINAQVLSEMEVPAVYSDALPKNGRSSLGEALYRTISAEKFSPDLLITSIDASHEHNVLEMLNRVEAATQIWRKKLQTLQMQVNAKDGKNNAKPPWALPNDGAAHLEKREELVGKAETLLLLLRQKFPGLPQTILDMNKIQYNKDVGQSILESYSRVLESLAFNITSRIDDVLHVDGLMKSHPHLLNGLSTKSSPKDLDDPREKPFHYRGLKKAASINSTGPIISPRSLHSKKLLEKMGWSVETAMMENIKQGTDQYVRSPPSLRSLYSKKLTEHGISPSKKLSEHATLHGKKLSEHGTLHSKKLSEHIAWETKQAGSEQYMNSPPWRLPVKNWSFSGTINGMRSPPSRD